MGIPYDDADENSIYMYSQYLEGKTFSEILEESKKWDYAVNKTDFSSKKNKGKCGNLLEEKFFGYQANSIQEPDFPKAGVELKVTPIDILKNGDMSAGERLVLTMISFNKAIVDDFYESDAWHKCRNILLVHYIRNNEIARFDNRIKYVNLFKPLEKDKLVFERDYAIIVDFIKRGKAEELSESYTNYLGACTKGIDSSKTVAQFYPPYARTKTRAYCFKRQYMQYILDVYILHKHSKYEVIVDKEELEVNSLEDIVISKLKHFYGKSTYELCNEFGIKYDKKANNNALWTTIVYRILGIKSTLAEEFVKAGITVKVSRVSKTNRIEECSPLPDYKFKELIKETWEESTLFKYLLENKFLWVTFKNNGDDYYLDKAQFWHVPYEDLISTVKQEWIAIQSVVKKGVTFTVKGGRVYNDIPGLGQTKIIHSRPAPTYAAYKLKDGFTKGDIRHNADELPDGQFMTKQSFWINYSYLSKQLGYK
ncbi:DNA mismatch repair endonuclease MutH [Butyrivibrio sp. ob235]|uniref:Sau3AI family type II restriction endonuclease n=1 Tax=Butyrivibrio sp. ob235 TaxID=1761780 RepID=UPI0008CB9679|nr:Sau3AI family type II restriction endonuclease [Butyrivibrio sp. ob235]SEM19767.1 DNA mismatch repair endonuclease MutH [Butyrivibrio sp. ob235]